MNVSDPALALAAAQAGAAVVRAKYGEPLARFAKSSTDFATEADLEAERAIFDVLRTARPDDSWLGEETGHAGPDGADRRWLVDPLCGTLNYAVQNPLVAVNVALEVDGVVTAAVSADPLADELFWTDGTTSYLRRRDRDEPLVPSAASRLVDVNLDPPFPNAERVRAVHLLADPRFVEGFRPRVMSTTLALAWVAAGRRAAYVTDGDMRDNVHFASGIALCRAAGCVVTSLLGGPVGSGAGGLLVAAGDETHAELLAMLDQPRR